MRAAAGCVPLPARRRRRLCAAAGYAAARRQCAAMWERPACDARVSGAAVPPLRQSMPVLDDRRGRQRSADDARGVCSACTRMYLLTHVTDVERERRRECVSAPLSGRRRWRCRLSAVAVRPVNRRVLCPRALNTSATSHSSRSSRARAVSGAVSGRWSTDRSVLSLVLHVHDVIG